MAKMSAEVKTAIEKTVPTCIATANKDGIPNIVYVTYLKYIDDETVVIADNKFSKTAANLAENATLSFVVLDADTKKAYQIKGDVEMVSEGERFDSVVEWVHVNHPQLDPNAACYLKVKEVYCGAEKIA